MAERSSAPKLLITIAVVLGIGLAASAYLNVVQNKRATDDHRLLTGTITDLRYQLGLDAAGNPTGSPTPKPSASPVAAATVSPTPPVVLGTQSVAIPELGVTLTASAPVADLTYSIIPASTAGAVVAGFNSPTFVGKYPSCTAGTALGQLVRRAKGAKAPASNKFVATLGEFSYYYYLPGANCTGPAGQADMQAAQAAIANTILKTLTTTQ